MRSGTLSAAQKKTIALLEAAFQRREELQKRRRLRLRRAKYAETQLEKRAARRHVRTGDALPVYGPLFNDPYFNPDHWLEKVAAEKVAAETSSKMADEELSGSPYAALLLANMKPSRSGKTTRNAVRIGGKRAYALSESGRRAIARSNAVRQAERGGERADVALFAWG